MKKTLIALAVLAASGASFAQATITGAYTFGYKQSQAANAASVAGFGTDTAAIQFSASEDLGGGLKAEAKVSFGGSQRGSSVGGEDAFVKLSGGFGTLTLGTIESANGLLAIGSSGASGFGLDGNVLGGSTNLDLVGLSVPLSSALTLGASYTDGGSAATTTAATAGTGLGVGTTGATNAQPSFTLGLTYSMGPLQAKIDATSWSRTSDADIAQGNGTALATGAAAAPSQSRYRISAGYDLGMARLSAGFSRASRTADVTVNEALFGVKIPLGAVTLGADFGQASTNTAGTVSADKSGYSLGASYAVSKRTSVSASYLNWTTKGVDGTNTGFRTFVSHSF